MREETYWISRQGGAKLRGSAGCLRPRSFSVMDAHRKKYHSRNEAIHVDRLEKWKKKGVQILQTEIITFIVVV